MKFQVLMLALLATLAAAAPTVEETQGKQYYWLRDLIMLYIDTFVFFVVAPWYWWAVFLGNPDAFNKWVVKFLNNDFWRLSYLYV